MKLKPLEPEPYMGHLGGKVLIGHGRLELGRESKVRAGVIHIKIMMG